MKRYLPLLILGCISVSVWVLGLHHYLSLETIEANYDKLEGYVASYPLLSMLIFMSAYVAVVGLSIPGATVMTIIGGMLFGQYLGTCAVVIAATLGATIVFVSAKMASQDILKRKAKSWIGKMQQGFHENAFSYLLTIRLIPIFPFVAINLVAAFFQVPLKTFILTTFVGIIPGSFIYVSLGDAVREALFFPKFVSNVLLEPKIIMALTGLGVLSLLPIVYKRFRNR